MSRRLEIAKGDGERSRKPSSVNKPLTFVTGEPIRKSGAALGNSRIFKWSEGSVVLNRTSRLLVTAAPLAASLALGMSASAGTGSFTDPSGDAKGAPDITAVSITSDATGMVQMSVTAPGLEAIDGAQEPEIDLYFNTDKNGSTGSPAGNEYDLYYWRTADDWGWDLDKWNGTKYAEAPMSQTLLFSRSGDTLTWRFSSKTDIVTSGFYFYAASGIFDASNNEIAEDDGPDDGVWTFDVSSAVIAPAIGMPLAVPASPVHGKLFSVSFPITRTDTGQQLQGGTLSVTTTIGGKVVAKNASLSNATAHVAVQVPAGAKGKTLVVKVTIAANGKTATRTIPYVIG
jgi:hypothetical protein